MTCGRCGEGNRDDARFCAACGAALVAPCPACGAAPARAGARFCDACGAPLGPEAPGPAGASARKVVTILFADLVGSTAAQEALDPESVRRWVGRYQATLREAVERHQGRVVKTTGDGLMAVFGVPDVREDDAQRALAAAETMQRAIAAMAGPAGAGERAAIRVGVNTGEVVVAVGDDDVVGDAVNVAARLEQAAGPGEVLVGETTYRLVRLGARLRALPPLALKGKAQPVPAFQLVSLEGPGDAGAGTPFVGRAGELERLSAVLDTAIQERRPQLVTVLGSPGVGKSRLARELAASAATRARVVEVRCAPDATGTFAPVAAALRSAVGLDDDADDDTVLAALTALFDAAEPDRDRIAQVAAGFLGVGDPGLPEEAFWAVRRLIENAARARPQVFVFEDVHWAEPLLLDLIEHVAEWARDAPMLLVATARPELRDLRPTLVEVGRRVRAVVVLEGLAVDESRRLTQALLGGTSLPDRLLVRIAAASEGNPLFVRELVRMLVEDGALQREEDRWAPAVALEQIEVPPSIHAVLAARIDRLSAPEQEVLGAASVLGRDFSRGAVAALVRPAVQERLDEIVEGLRRKELVEPAGTYWLDEPVLRFHHALVQDAAYRRLLKDTRAELHERAARWLEAKAGDLVEQEGAIGLQLEQAHHLGVETGHVDGTLGRQAAGRLSAAGRRALEADDLPGAATFLGRALRCLPAGDPDRAGLVIDRCEALLALGDATEAAPAVDELLAVAGDDERARAWGTCFAAELANLRDAAHLAETAERAAAAAEVLAGLGDAAGEAKAHAVRAGSLARLGRIGDSEVALDRALAAARRAGDRRRATAILAGAPTAALWGPTPVTRASGRCLDVVRVLRITSRSSAVEATSLRCQAVLEALRGRADAARRMVAAARRSLEELGHEHGLVELDLAAGTVELLSGDLEEAERLLARAHEGFHALGVDVDAARAAALLARAHLGQDHADEALALTVEAEQLGGDDLKAGIAWRAVRAEALADRGDLAEARRLAEEAVALAAPTDALVDHADALVALAEVLRRSGAEAEAVARAREGIALYERKEATVPAQRARALAGGLEVGSAVQPATATAVAAVDEEGRYGGNAVDDPDQLDAVRADLDRPARRASPVAFDLRQATKAATAGAALEPLVVRVARLACAAMVEGAWDRLATWFDEAVEGRDHRPLLGGTVLHGRDEVLEGYRQIMALGVTEMLIDPVALRGERACVVRIDHGSPLGAVEVLQLLTITAEGRFTRGEIWDVDQLDDAIMRLEAVVLEDGGVTAPAALDLRSNVASRFYAEVFELARAEQWEVLAATLTPDVRFVDHRPVVGAGLATDGPQGALAYGRSVIASGAELVDTVTVAIRGHRFALIRASHAGDGATVEVLMLVELGEDGRIRSCDVFEPAQLREAVEILDSRYETTLDELRRTRWALARRVIRAMSDHDTDALGALLRPDARLVDHRPLSFGEQSREGWLALYPAISERIPDVWWLVVSDLGISARAAFGVTEMRGTAEGGAFENPAIAVTELDRTGTSVVRMDVFPEADVAAAAARYAELQAEETLDNAAVRSVRARMAGIVGQRWEEVAALLAPEVVRIDHRALTGGYELRGRAAVLEAQRALLEVGVTAIDVQPLAVRGDHACLARTSMRRGDESFDVLQVFTVDDHGRGLRGEVFDPDQLAVAMARLDELWAEPQPVGGRYARVVRSMVACAVADDWEGYLDHLHPDAELLDRRSLVGGLDFTGRDAIAELFRAAVGVGLTGIDVEPIATRGDRLVLDRRTYRGTEFATEALQVAELDEQGRIRRTIAFDPDQLDDAFHELDARFEASLPRMEAAAWRAFCTANQAMNRRDLEALRRALTDDAVVVDHRPLSLGRITAAAWLESLAAGFAESPDVRWPFTEVLELSDRALLALAEMEGTRAGGAFTGQLVVVAQTTGARLARLEFFAAEDLATARSRFVAVDGGGDAPTPALVARYRRVFERMVEAGLAGDWERYREMLLPDAELVDRRQLLGGLRFSGRDAIVELDRSIIGIGVGAVDIEPLAIRGERLLLDRRTYRGPGGAADTLQVVELDEHDRIGDTVVFDPWALDDAVAELDGRFAASLAPELGRTWREVASATALLARHDLEAAKLRLTEDMAFVDHRPVGFGGGTGAAWLDSIGTAISESDDVRWLMTEVLDIADGRALVRSEMRGTRAGGPFALPSLVICEVRQGLVAHLEFFAAEDLAAARARFAELGAGGRP